MSPRSPEHAKLQRLIDLTAQMENFAVKIRLGMQPSVEEYDRLSDNQREYAELLGFFNLHPPRK